jgi:hypothetical protein
MLVANAAAACKAHARRTALVVEAAGDVDHPGDVVIFGCVQDDTAAGLGVAYKSSHCFADRLQVLPRGPHVLRLWAPDLAL